MALRFLWGMMCEPSGDIRRVLVAREWLSFMRCVFIRNDLDAVMPWFNACWRYPVGVWIACSAIGGRGSGRSHCIKIEVLHHSAHAESPLALFRSLGGRIE